jgi:uncharacterized membrane protein
MSEYIKTPHWFHRMASVYKLIFSFAIAVIISLSLSWIRMEGTTRLMVAWDAFSLSMIGIALSTFFSICPKQIRVLASHEDNSRIVVFGIVLLAILGSLLGILLLLGNRHGWLLSKHLETLIYLTGVSASWALLHIMFTFRYAHLFYSKHAVHKHDLAGGLELPEEKCPDYLDFAYFSFVIGMTFQVSDIQVTSRLMRRLVLLHGLLSFLFNTVIVALTINVVVDFRS